MTRPLPKCAQCGESLARAGETVSGRVLIGLHLAGSPIVGWHGACGQHDPAYQQYVRGVTHARLLLAAVLARSPDRVAAGKSFWAGAGRVA